MNPGRPPFRRYNRWSKSSVSDENNLRAAVEELRRAAVAEGTGEAEQSVAGVPFNVPRQPEEFWLLLTGVREGGAYLRWSEVVQDGAGGFTLPADGLEGSAALPAYELYGRSVPVTTVPSRAWLSQTEPLCAVFDGSAALLDVENFGGDEAALWCNVTDDGSRLVLQDQEGVAAVIRLADGQYRVIFLHTFRSPEAFEWSGNCKSAAFLWEVDRTAFSVTVQASTLADVPRWGIDARGHLAADSIGSAGSGGGSGQTGQWVNVGCLPTPQPPTLYATFSGSGPTDGVYPLTYDSVGFPGGAWIYTGLVGTCHTGALPTGEFPTLAFRCNATNNQWELFTGYDGMYNFASSVTEDPFTVVFLVVLTGACGDGSDATVTVRR